MKRFALAALLAGSAFLATEAGAQPRIGVCGPPPLPPCVEPGPTVREGFSRPTGGAFGTVCRTPELRCRLDDPRPIGARCVCFDEDDEPQRGRVR